MPKKNIFSTNLSLSARLHRGICHKFFSLFAQTLGCYHIVHAILRYAFFCMFVYLIGSRTLSHTHKHTNTNIHLPSYTNHNTHRCINHWRQWRRCRRRHLISAMSVCQLLSILFRVQYLNKRERKWQRHYQQQQQQHTDTSTNNENSQEFSSW